MANAGRIRCAGTGCLAVRRYTNRRPEDVAESADWQHLGEGRYLCVGCRSTRRSTRKFAELPPSEQDRYDRIMRERAEFKAETLESMSAVHDAGRPEGLREWHETQRHVQSLELTYVRFS
jgi:hypothetical protein